MAVGCRPNAALYEVLVTLGSLILSVLLSSPSLAQDSGDEFDIDDLDIGDPAEETTDDDDATDATDATDEEETDEPVEEDPEGEELDAGLFGLEEGEEVDLLEEEGEAVTGDRDTEAEYRRTERELQRLGADEEVTEWERYLERYPNTVFRSRIEDRIDTLMDELFSRTVGQIEQSDAMREEIGFAQPLLLENIDPRSRLQLAFEWGFPTYLGFVVDYEAQIARNFSIHAGLRRRYQGVNLEFGPHWAIVKSTRTNTLLTLIADVRLNASPFFPAVRPQLAFGKRIGKLDLQAQAGVDLEFRERFVPLRGDVLGVEPRIVGGINLYYAASERVGIFAEAGVFMKPVGGSGAIFSGGTFAFNTASAGLKFFPSNKNRPDARNMEANLGVNVPAGQNWWQFHAGSIAGQFNYYVGQ